MRLAACDAVRVLARSAAWRGEQGSGAAMIPVDPRILLGIAALAFLGLVLCIVVVFRDRGRW